MDTALLVPASLLFAGLLAGGEVMVLFGVRTPLRLSTRQRISGSARN